MATTSDVLTRLKAFTGKPNDDTYLKAALISALREVRNERAPWSEGTFRFYTEQNTTEYGTSYPGVPSDLLMFDSVNCSVASVGGTAVIQPDTIVTKTNLTEGASDTVTLGWIQDRPHDPDPRTNHKWTASGAGAIAWKMEFEAPENAVPEGSGRQKTRLLLQSTSGTPSPTVALTDESSGSTTVFSQTPTLSTTATIFEYTWDARMLDVNPPTGLRLQLSHSDETSELLAAEWITDYTSTSDTRPMHFMSIDQIQHYLGSAGRTATGIPMNWCWHHDKFIVEPRPQGVYEIYGTYLKDSTRDSNGDEITTSFVGTETNDWLDRGLHALEAKALEIYYMHRAQNATAAQMARMQYLDSLKSIRRESIFKNFRGPVRGYL